MLGLTPKTIFAFFVLMFLKGSIAMASDFGYVDLKPFINPKSYFIETDTGRVWLEQEEGHIHTIVEISPQFPGGTEALMGFIQSNRRMRHGSAIPQGTVFVTFVVERDGSLSNTRILRGIDPLPEIGADAEAIRLVESMPNWIPGKTRNQVVRTQFNLPIRFTIAG
ncbi:MAG: energy transducer TonB [Bacteroidales bacterium]|nr:energy transducer TonB [Bacteroidales bacterium]